MTLNVSRVEHTWFRAMGTDCLLVIQEDGGREAVTEALGSAETLSQGYEMDQDLGAR